jgi:sec-independent protein translocase protein TatA
MSFGLVELAILLFIVFLIMGPKRITNLFQALGRGVHDFVDTLGRDKKNELTEEEDSDRQLRKK